MDENLNERSKSEEGENENKPLKVFCTKKSEEWHKYPHSDFFFLYLIFHNETTWHFYTLNASSLSSESCLGIITSPLCHVPLRVLTRHSAQSLKHHTHTGCLKSSSLSTFHQSS